MFLSERSFTPEIMDLGSFTSEEYETCLREIQTINRLTTGYRPTLNALRKVAELTTERPLKILDIGFGYGDSLRVMANWARKNNLAVEIYGIELNPQATQIAKKMTPTNLKISFRTQDVFEIPAGERYHFITNSMMAHHLTDAQLSRLMRWMSEQTKVAWFINDLHRHWLAYGFIKFFTKIFGFNRLICHDAPLSVARSFRQSEWSHAISAAGLDTRRAIIEWWWAFRFGVFYHVL